jgi:hypothetical protein
MPPAGGRWEPTCKGTKGQVIKHRKATDASGGISIRTLELTAVPAYVAVLASPHLLADGSFQLTLVGQTNQAYSLQVSTDLTTWTDWTNMTTTSSSTPLADLRCLTNNLSGFTGRARANANT